MDKEKALHDKIQVFKKKYHKTDIEELQEAILEKFANVSEKDALEMIQYWFGEGLDDMFIDSINDCEKADRHNLRCLHTFCVNFEEEE